MSYQIWIPVQFSGILEGCDAILRILNQTDPE